MKYRQKLNFNTDWQFISSDRSEAKEPHIDIDDLKKVNLPHTNKILPHHYFDESEYQFISWYRRDFYLNKDYTGKRIIVEFDGVMSVAEVYINGKYVGEHKGGYNSFSFDITDQINLGRQNVIAVRVDSRQRKDIPPEGGLVDYLLFGGIYRNVRMIILDPLYINWAFYRMEEVTQERAVLKPEFELYNKYKYDKHYIIETKIYDQKNDIVKKKQSKCKINPGKHICEQENIIIEKPNLWHPDSPYLYRVITRIKMGKKYIDDHETRIGLRDVSFNRQGQFQINGETMKLRGLNRHQMFPYLGNAMPTRGQKKDAEILKNQLGLNFVRSSHYPADPAFLDRCDELGLLVFEEIPGWQYIGDEDWKAISKENVREMIIRDRNHPSIFIWGVRINESDDDYDFYKATNEIAHELDPTRDTGGVRNMQDSEFLEDVFTYNDFELNLAGEINPPNNKPYMITEYMGHMYPTKSYDSVERLIKHAIKHAQIQDAQYSNKEIAGACGWCAFDYNTHADFGSGDRVCYHGVCDMFRLPKFAAHFYRSQMDPAKEKVVFIARYLTPSFNEDYGNEIIVFSNCEEIELYVGDKLYATSGPDRSNYPGLPHPPFVFNDCKWWEWGASTIDSLQAVGKINGQEVARHSIYPFGQPNEILLQADYNNLIADGSDTTRVVVKLLDENKQTLHLAHHPVRFSLTGPGELIGENPLSLEAGRGAVYVRGGRKPGKVILKASVKGLPGVKTIITLHPLKERIVPVKANSTC